MKTAVKIHDLSGIETKVYIAQTEDDCRDKTDLDVYRTVVRFGAVITMGKVIGEPIRIKEVA